MLRYLDAFENFDPLSAPLSEELIWKVGYQIQQAKLLLPENFTIDNLNAGLELLYQIKRVEPVSATEQIAALENLPLEEKMKGLFSSPPRDYFLRAERVTLPELGKDQPFLWSWLFATASLASAADYVSLKMGTFIYSKSGPGIDTQPGPFEFDQIDYLLMESIESLGYARVFADRETRKARQKAIGEKVSKVKLNNFHPLKQKVVEIYEGLKKPMSYRKAAKTIFSQLPEELKLISSSDDPVHQIEKWLGQYEKGTLRGEHLLAPSNSRKIL